MTINELRKDILNSKKSKDIKRTQVLLAILDNAQKIAKADKNREANEIDIVAGAKAELKMANQSKDSGAPYNDLTFEIVESFLPKQMSDRELDTTIQSIIDSLENPSIGLIMKELKTYGDSINMNKASTLIKTKLS